MSKKSKTQTKRKKIDSLLKEVLEKMKPPKEDLELIENSMKEFLGKLRKNLKVLKINAEIFVGGSFAKNTIIKKDAYDADIFIRYEKKYSKENISELLGRALKGVKNVSKVHGSRDYFRIKINPQFFIEVIPVLKIKNPKEAENVTDLSYSHVNYINKKIKSEKILEDIRIAKAFCYANNCYGAESYIGGFSGYALELLVYHYKGFMKFIKAASRMGKEKIVIDIEKHFRNKQAALMDINSSKLESPIILVDPTYKQRNALAALSEETFEKFRKTCRKFLKKPSMKFFEPQKTDLKKIERDAKKRKHEFLLFELKTEKQEGDIAGSKLLKFYRHLNTKIEDFFVIKNKGFFYNGDKTAKCFFVVKSRGETISAGPYLKDRKNAERFRKKHKIVFEKNGRIYAKEKINFTLKEFLKRWKIKNKIKMRDMGISELVLS